MAGLENELLLVCARVNLNSRQEARIRALLREKLNWSSVLKRASRHGLTQLLFYHLNAVCPRVVPQTVLGRLRRQFHANAGRNLLLASELLKLLQLFERHDVGALPFKGPVLSTAVYGNLALRSFGDLDLLVRRKDFMRAHGLLLSQGYRPEFPMTRTQEAVFLKLHPVHALIQESSGVTVELHWNPTPYFSLQFSPEGLWQRSSRIDFGSASIPTFSPEDLLLILCAHGAKHLWRRLEWICGVAELVRRHRELDWEQVAGQAYRVGSERILRLGLLLASDLLGVRLPPKAPCQVSEDRAVDLLATQARQRLFGGSDGFTGYFARTAFHLRVRERWGDRASYALRIAARPTPEEVSRLSLPPSLFFLYFLFRPIRLIVRMLSFLLPG